MPVDIVSFRLKPVGFFDRNPALDVAPQAGTHEPGALRAMSRYGPQYGPDITFLGVPRCTWDEPGDLRRTRTS